MNFLGHLYFSGENQKLMVANLFGDFVKGRDYSYLPQIVQKGVMLHRNIDDYIDHFPEVTALRLKLYADLPKIAGIAIDLYFDHLLAKNWNTYHPQALNAYVDDFIQYISIASHLEYQENNFTYPPEFQHLLSMMKKYNWLKSYAFMEGLEKSSIGLSKRIAFENNLDEAAKVYLMYESEIENTFEIYMKAAKIKFRV